MQEFVFMCINCMACCYRRNLLPVIKVKWMAKSIVDEPIHRTKTATIALQYIEYRLCQSKYILFFHQLVSDGQFYANRPQNGCVLADSEWCQIVSWIRIKPKTRITGNKCRKCTKISFCNENTCLKVPSLLGEVRKKWKIWSSFIYRILMLLGYTS